jgi:hypothetical protein
MRATVFLYSGVGSGRSCAGGQPKLCSEALSQKKKRKKKFIHLSECQNAGHQPHQMLKSM